MGYCKKKVTTSSGTFYAHNTKRYKCGAERYCKDRGQILAPITTQEDKDAITEMLEDCGGKNILQSYNTGLEINMCGGKAHWDFSNGVKWDHGPLYGGFNVVKKQLANGRRCGRGFFEVAEGGGLGVRTSANCDDKSKMRYICLDPAKPKASALGRGDESGVLFSNFSLTVVFGMLLAVVLVLVCVSVKSYRPIRKLRKENRINSELNV